MAVFARKASGLTREASMFDAFAFGFMNNGLGVGLWSMHSWGLYTFPGGNMVLGSIISGVLTVLGVSLAWGILGGSMPRSGGDYIYNSRIVHPALGTATSWAQGLFVSTAWIWVLAPWMADPGLLVLAGAVGIPPEAIEFWITPVGMLLVASLVNAVSFLIVVFGFRAYLRMQKITFIVGMIGVLIGLILLSMTTQHEFASRWDYIAAENGSPTYLETIKLARDVGFVQETWNWWSTFGLVPSCAWATTYGFCIGYIGGEIKRPERNILLAQVLAALIPTIFLAWAGYVLQNNVGYEFMHAIAYIDNEEPEWYTMPFPPNWANLAAVLTDNLLLRFLIGLNFMAFDFYWIPFSYLVFSRVAFAQGMDLIGPRWFTDINPRFNTPVKLFALEGVLGEATIIHYCFYPEYLGGLSVTGLDAITVWGILGIVCMLFPFVKKVRHIWDSSPHRWYIGPIPVATVAGFISIIFTGIVIWAIYASPAMGGLNIYWTPIYISVMICGVIWYLGWRWKRAREGIDVTLSFKELPPE